MTIFQCNVSELQERFHGAALMAPAVYWRNAEDANVLFSYFTDLIEDIFEDMGKYCIINTIQTCTPNFVPLA